MKERVTLEILGMTCNSCVESIEGHIGSQKGVLAVNVSLIEKSGIFDVDTDLTNKDEACGLSSCSVIFSYPLES